MMDMIRLGFSEESERFERAKDAFIKQTSWALGDFCYETTTVILPGFIADKLGHRKLLVIVGYGLTPIGQILIALAVGHPCRTDCSLRRRRYFRCHCAGTSRRKPVAEMAGWFRCKKGLELCELYDYCSPVTDETE